MICGALKWLQDHNTSEREGLESYLKELNETSLDNSSSSDPFDWLNQQAKDVEARQRKIETKNKLDLIYKYDEKLSKMKLSCKQRVGQEKRGPFSFLFLFIFCVVIV